MKQLLCIAITCLTTTLSIANSEKMVIQNFQDAFNIIKENYVDQTSDDILLKNAINGMLESLDPYSSFLTKEEYKEMEMSTKGEFGGIGVEIKVEEGLFTISIAHQNLPGYKTGIRSGDVILTVNGETISGMNVNQVQDLLKGEPGTKLKLKIYKPSGEIKDLTLKRETINILPIKVKIYNDIIYAKIGSFTEKTANILNAEIQKILKKRRENAGIILDLRDNLGGLLDEAVLVAKLFLENATILSTTSISHNREENQIIYQSDKKDITNNMPMVVLINNGSASSAEIVAAALQDNKRAILIGQKSYCKGSIQSIIPFKGIGAIKLTTGKFYTPSGRSIQSDCVKPDIYISEKEKSEKHDYSLDRAINLINDIKLYKYNQNNKIH